MGRGRDRDADGHPRNARPRDAAGRPLPRGDEGVDRVPEDVVLAPAEAVREAQRLLDAGYPFHAHEVLEAAWKTAEPEHRDLWQGLAQLAVGLTQLQRGNASGAVSLLCRGADRIASQVGATPYQLDVAGLHAYATALAARLETDGPDAVTPADVRPRLQVPGPA